MSINTLPAKIFFKILIMWGVCVVTCKTKWWANRRPAWNSMNRNELHSIIDSTKPLEKPILNPREDKNNGQFFKTIMKAQAYLLHFSIFLFYKGTLYKLESQRGEKTGRRFANRPAIFLCYLLANSFQVLKTTWSKNDTHIMMHIGHVCIYNNTFESVISKSVNLVQL